MHVCQLIKMYGRNLLKGLKVPNETETIPGSGGGALKGMVQGAKWYGVENPVLISLNEIFTRKPFLYSALSSVSF